MEKTIQTIMAAVAVAAFLVWRLMAAPVAADTPGTASLDTAVAFQGSQATVAVSADVPAPGLGAWTLGIGYDPAVVAPAGCTEDTAMQACNIAAGPGLVIIAGVDIYGLEGPVVLAEVAFECIASGSSALTLTVRDVFVDAEREQIAYTLQDGRIDCLPGADLDHSGETNAIDALLILQGVAGLR